MNRSFSPIVQWFFPLGLLWGSLLMVLAAQGDLWLDEVWSIEIIQHLVQSPLDILLKVRHDNNHLLNSFWIFLIGYQHNLVLYRLPSVVAGILTIALLGQWLRRWGRLEANFFVYLAGTAYPLVLYFSEARGYGLAMFFSVAACVVFLTSQGQWTLGNLLKFWLCLILGLLAHLSVVIVFLALILTSLGQAWRDRAESWRDSLLQLGKLYAVPSLFLVGLYLSFIRGMTYGGGPLLSKGTVLQQTALIALGLPESSPFGIGAVVAVAIILAIGVFSLSRGSSAEWLFFLLILVIAPVLTVLVLQPKILYVRYFMVCFPWFYALCSLLLGQLYQTSQRGKVLALGLAAVLIMGQVSQIIPLLQLGRGNYSQALQYLQDHSLRSVITIGTDQPFETRMMIEFYARRGGLTPPIVIPQEEWWEVPPEWLILASPDWVNQSDPSLTIASVGHYQQVPFPSPLKIPERFRWFVYQWVAPNEGAMLPPR